MSSRSDRDKLARKLFDERFACRARHYGDAEAKKDTATARRLATALRKVADAFGRYLPAEEAKTLAATVAVIENLASSLAGAASLASKAQADELLQAEQAREARAEQVAAELWGAGAELDRPRLLHDCRDLVEFIDLADAPGGSAKWMSAHAPQRYALLDELSEGARGAPLRQLLEAYEKHPGPAFLASLRRRAAEYMTALRDQSRPGHWSGAATLTDFAGWKASRSEVPTCQGQ